MTQIICSIGLFWEALGFQLSRRRGKPGSEVDWIGATFHVQRVNHVVSGISFAISAEEAATFEEQASVLASRGYVCRKAQEFAGLVPWVVGTLRPTI